MIINNKDHFSNETFDNHSPINTEWLLARLPQGTAEDAERAIAGGESRISEMERHELAGSCTPGAGRCRPL